MKKFLLSLAVLGLLSTAVDACDKCGKSHGLMYSPSYVQSYAVASTPVQYTSQMAVAPMMVAAPQTFTTQSVQSVQYVSPQLATINAAPMYYTVPSTQSAFVTQSFVPQSLSTPSTLYYMDSNQAATMSSAQTQSFLGDLLLRTGANLAKPVACEICKNLNCGTGTGTGSDSVGDFRNSFRGMTDFIREFKEFEKEIKKTIDGTTSVEEPPVDHDSELAKLTQIRDELRAMNRVADTTRVATDDANE